MELQDKIIMKLVEMDAKIDHIQQEMVTKDSLREVESRINTRLDEQSVILKRLDEERLFTYEWIRRIESDVENIKRRLQIA